MKEEKYIKKIAELEQIIEITGRKELKITIYENNPEIFLLDRSLVGLEGEELQRVLKKPFMVIKDLLFKVEFKNKLYYFTIPLGYEWNGANVPPFCWLIIGQQKEPRFKLASCVHDYLCENKEVIEYNRYLSTLIFETLCKYFGRFNTIKTYLIFHSVDNYQKLQGWRRKNV